MNNFINEDVYNTYFGIKSESGESTAPEKRQFVYADNKSAKVHTKESVFSADYQIQSFRHSPLYNQVVAYDGITALSGKENLKLYCNVRMIQMCISYINKLFQYYIGQNMYKIIKDKIIINDLSNILNAISSKGIITEYEFDILPDYARGEIKVYLSLLTCYMVKAVKICSVINLEFAEEEE